jgi:hypothetical protein
MSLERKFLKAWQQDIVTSIRWKNLETGVLEKAVIDRSLS